MKVCFPVELPRGLESQVYGHFGSAPGFVIVDTDANTVEEFNNTDAHHAHGMCSPIKALGERRVDAIVVGGIGMGALMKLRAEGVRVFRAAMGTVEENTRLILKKTLPEFDPALTCGGHAGGGGCAH